MNRTPEGPPRLGFSQRVQRRYDLFWRRRQFSLHTRGLCQLAYLSRHDPLESWHCCPFWQRKLSNKWNSREFAMKLGGAVPELYWSGTRVGEIPFDDLPQRYVVRPVVGHSRQGVFVVDRGVNLLDGEAYDPERIRANLRPYVRGLPRRRILVEELVPPEPGCPSPLPRDYKFHVFGERIGAIQVIERGVGTAVTTFDDGWNLLPNLRPGDRQPAIPPPRPHCFDELCAVATRLGTAFGSYVRVDLYVGPRGPLFGEFAATPAKGRGFGETADRRLGELWELVYPGRL